MRNFEITYKDAESKINTIVVEAEAADLDLGQKIMDMVDEKYGCNSETDGTDVWFTDENGEVVYAMKDMQIAAEEE